jgi:hypothetical protein
MPDKAGYPYAQLGSISHRPGPYGTSNQPSRSAHSASSVRLASP